MATENLVTGKYYRILKDKANDVWDRISFWTHSDDVQTASGITLTNDLVTKDTKISATQNDFAMIEATSVSTHPYVIGNMLVYNNQLYRVISAIAVGATLVPGTNIEAVNVGTLSNMLTTSDGKGFNFDVKDGTYGFYPSASKLPEEFVPFGGSAPELVYLGSYPTTSSFDLTSYDHYKDFTNDSFIFKNISGTARSQSRGEYMSISCNISAISVSYDNSTGILTLSGGSGHARKLGPDQTMALEIWANTIADVYVMI